MLRLLKLASLETHGTWDAGFMIRISHSITIETNRLRDKCTALETAAGPKYTRTLIEST